MERKKEIVAFDFDGTLTRRDTLIAFACRERGTLPVACWLARHALRLVAVKLGLRPGGAVKEEFFARFFGGMDDRAFSLACQSFAQSGARLLRPGGMETVAAAVGRGATVLIVSASVDRWVEPFFDAFGGKVAVVATQVEVSGGVITGRFATPNCNGAEKTRRILALFPDRQAYRLVAYGDSRGDREMLAMADEAHYKPFRH